MRLLDWLQHEGIEQAEFARHVSLHPITICKYANGRMMPRPDVAARIEHATRGRVTIKDFADAVQERRAPRVSS